jgi:hypothetical protein
MKEKKGSTNVNSGRESFASFGNDTKGSKDGSPRSQKK